LIAIDIDGVIADSEEVLVNQLEQFTGQEFIPPVPRTYDFREGFRGLHLKDCLDNIDIAISNNSNKISVHDYNRTYLALAKIQNSYGEVHLITARSSNIWFETEEWLVANFGMINFKIHNIGHYGNKEQIMTDNGLLCLVDDRLKIVNELKDPRMIPYLVNRPWNAGRTVNSNVIRVDDLLEAVNHHLKDSIDHIYFYK